MVVDGEIQPDFAMNSDHLSDYPFSKLGETPANCFVFPNLESANLSYKIIRGMKVSQTIGPILMGLNKPVHIVQMRSSVDEIVNLATIAVLDAQIKEKEKQISLTYLYKSIFPLERCFCFQDNNFIFIKILKQR